MKINKCSLTGIAVNIDADNPYELLEQTSYYPVNFYGLDTDNNGWYPSKITFSDFSNYAMACYPGSTNISEIKYVFDIKDAGDYIFAFKLHNSIDFIIVQYNSGDSGFISFKLSNNCENNLLSYPPCNRGKE
jgi:hypothetical protein